MGLCLEAPRTQLTRSLYPQGWNLKPPPCWRHWRPWRWSWSLGRRWRSPKWLGEALMTHLCTDGVMVPQKKAHLPHKWWHDGFWPLEASWCGWGGWRRPWCPCKGHGAHYWHLIWLDGMMSLDGDDNSWNGPKCIRNIFHPLIWWMAMNLHEALNAIKVREEAIKKNSSHFMTACKN